MNYRYSMSPFIQFNIPCSFFSYRISIVLLALYTIQSDLHRDRSLGCGCDFCINTYEPRVARRDNLRIEIIEDRVFECNKAWVEVNRINNDLTTLLAARFLEGWNKVPNPNWRSIVPYEWSSCKVLRAVVADHRMLHLILLIGKYVMECLTWHGVGIK